MRGRPFRFLVRAAIAVVICVLSSAATPAQPTIVSGKSVSPARTESKDSVKERWQVNYLGDKRIGYEYSRQHTEHRDKQNIIVTVSESQSTLERFGQKLHVATSLRTEETEAGDLLKFAFELKNPPIQTTRSEGAIKENELELTSTVAGKTTTRRIAWESDAKSPGFPDRLISSKPLEPGKSHATKVYLPEFAKFSRVTLTADDFRPVKLLDRKEHSLLRVKVNFLELPEISSRMYVTSTGETLMTEVDMLGLTARSYAVSRDEALKAIAGAELDIAINTLVRLDRPIVEAHRKKKIVYRVTGTDESPERQFVVGGTQQVKALSDKTIELTVVSKPLPSANSRSVASEPRFLAASRFLQVNDPTVRDHADRAAGGETDPIRIATKMEKYVAEKFTKKNFSTAMATASEVAQRMEGDCTEHAVLLAAMLRAKKVPSRIAAGLVYVDQLNAFGGHMWTEAYLAGDWIPLDATLGKGGIGAAHLKMAESAMDEDAPVPITTFLPLLHSIGKLKIEVVKAE